VSVEGDLFICFVFGLSPKMEGGGCEDGDTGGDGSWDSEHSVRALATVKMLLRSRLPWSGVELVS
jgi:hypothetical protein